MHIYSISEKADGAKFDGRKLNTAFYKYFYFDNFLKSNLTDKTGSIFCCYKFKLTQNLTGLIIRRRSQYSESAVDLCIWDNGLEKVIQRIELADGFGDGDWFFVKDAWLKDLNSDGQIDIVTRKMEHWEDDFSNNEDNNLRDSANVINDSIEKFTDSVKVFVLKKGNFKLSKISIKKDNFRLFDWE